MKLRNVQLELVRPGPPHNQLLSPLTQYIALCGESSPITFRIDFEHRRLLRRLERLRGAERPTAGERELAELGADVGNLFGSIPSLSAEMASARRDASDPTEQAATMVHLRLVLSGSELSLVPFEVAVAPQAMPGEGIGMLLQGRVPIVATREIRRSRPLPARLDLIDEVRVLYAYAEPPGYGSVPSNEHLQALREALEPWIGEPGPAMRGESAPATALGAQRLSEIKRHLRVLPNATLDDIYEACASEPFTHIHILGHGARYTEADEDRYGIALHSRSEPGDVDIVSGQRLAYALGAESDEGTGRSRPFWVTLATCDAGNTGSVLAPGGSIAHDLHSYGIPWVLASQFPLSKAGSVAMTGFLYPRLFRGDDPRQALYELRRYLYCHQNRYHDWASLVTYAAIPADFDQHVGTFFEKATKAAIERLMSTADDWSEVRRRGRDRTATHDSAGDEVSDDAVDARITSALAATEPLFDRWKQRLSAGPSMVERQSRTNFHGMRASVRKRQALLKSTARGGMSDGFPTAEAARDFEESRNAYREAVHEFAVDDGKFTWTASQYLALSAMSGRGLETDLVATCRTVVQRDLRFGTAEAKAWALATLAELELLRIIDATDPDRLAAALTPVIEDHCAQLLDLMGPFSFAVESTRRQFQRYVTGWGALAPDVTASVKAAAAAAVAALGGTED